VDEHQSDSATIDRHHILAPCCRDRDYSFVEQYYRADREATEAFWVVAIGIVMVPVYLRCMGREAYGLVGFFAVLSAWLALLDLGLSPDLAREAARYRAGALDAALETEGSGGVNRFREFLSQAFEKGLDLVPGFKEEIARSKGTFERKVPRLLRKHLQP
jgi:hypothetical protein